MADVVGGVIVELPEIGFADEVEIVGAITRHGRDLHAVFAGNVTREPPVEDDGQVTQESQVVVVGDDGAYLVHENGLLVVQQTVGQRPESRSALLGIPFEAKLPEFVFAVPQTVRSE